MDQAGAAFYAQIEGGVFGRRLDFLNRLDRAHIFYRLGLTRPDSVMIDISLPDWRWEIAGVGNDPGLLRALFVDADPH